MLFSFVSVVLFASPSLIICERKKRICFVYIALNHHNLFDTELGERKYLEAQNRRLVAQPIPNDTRSGSYWQNSRESDMYFAICLRLTLMSGNRSVYIQAMIAFHGDSKAISRCCWWKLFSSIHLNLDLARWRHMLRAFYTAFRYLPWNKKKHPHTPPLPLSPISCVDILA